MTRQRRHPTKLTGVGQSLDLVCALAETGQLDRRYVIGLALRDLCRILLHDTYLVAQSNGCQVSAPASLPVPCWRGVGAALFVVICELLLETR